MLGEPSRRITAGSLRYNKKGVARREDAFGSRGPRGLALRPSRRSDKLSNPSRPVPHYLVLRSAGRWSDVFRLSPDQDVTLGRSSANEIVIRSENASRRHARVWWDGESWRVEDLGSRNGTRVNGTAVTAARVLDDRDLIEIAGFAIEFTSQLDVGSTQAPVDGGADQATDDQMTMGPDEASVTGRRRRSRHLHGTDAEDPSGEQTRSLLRLAFSLAACDTVTAAAEITLDTLTAHVPFASCGIYGWEAGAGRRAAAARPGRRGAAKGGGSGGDGGSGGGVPAVESMPLSATRQSGTAVYRRPPGRLVDEVVREGGEAILARNVVGDERLATADSHGEIDVESLILAPVCDTTGVIRGMIHVTTEAPEPPLTVDSLEFTVAAAEILGESLANLADRHRLDHSLRRSRQQIAELRSRLDDHGRIVGRSEPIRELLQNIGLVAPTSTTVLVRGESGVGKELVAAAIHHASPRREGPLVCLNCAALTPTLLESELFGHEKGAFTGATERKRGKFEAADGGTLMLDEIGEMDADLQAKFLRVLEGHPFERVGGHEPIRCDVRVVAATHRDLRQMVSQGAFRQDLYYRLAVIEIAVPPLRDRGRDCLELADFFLKRFNREMGRRIEGLTPAAQQRLLHYSWPGNVRELKNVIERAVVLNTKSVIDEADIALLPTGEGPGPGGAASLDAARSADGSPGDASPDAADGWPTETTLADLERRHIGRVLRHTGGNKTRAATILGIERSTLDRKLKRYSRSKPKPEPPGQ